MRTAVAQNVGDTALTLHFATWNLGELPATEWGLANLDDWIGASSPADFVCVGFQEALEGDEGDADAMRDLVSSHLNKGGNCEYVHLSTSVLRKIQVHLFAKAATAIGGVAAGGINTSREGTSKSGGKGAAAIALTLDTAAGPATIGLVCCHLTSHPERLSERLTDAETILSELRVGGAGCAELDHLVVFGDLNFRVDLDFAPAEELVATSRKHGFGTAERQAQLDTLLASDQLMREKAAGRAFPGFSEASIHFEPTYKFKPNTAPRVLSNKRNQAASYCDRVLYKQQTERARMTQLSYGATPWLNMADHTPVCARFAVLL